MTWLRILAVLALLAGGGCAPLAPVPSPLNEAERQEAEALLVQARNNPRLSALDADIVVEWDVMLESGQVPGTLLLKLPSGLRLSLLDPLGRPLLLFGVDGQRFTQIDVAKAHVRQGRLDSPAWQGAFPLLLPPELLAGLLLGQVEFDLQDLIPEGNGEDGYWYAGSAACCSIRVLLERENAMPKEFQLMEGPRSVVTIRYEGLLQTPSGGRIPRRLTISGAQVQGRYTLSYEHIFRDQLPSEVRFDLTIPPHFTVEERP